MRCLGTLPVGRTTLRVLAVHGSIVCGVRIGGRSAVLALPASSKPHVRRVLAETAPCMPKRTNKQSLTAARGRKALRVAAVFEKFTERSIKSVMISQQEAKLLGASEVNTEHILLGLISEETISKNGYLNSGLTAERAKTAVESLFGKKRPLSSTENSIPFSREVRRTFEAATNECKRSGVNFISPEHILLAMLNMPESSGRKVFDSLGIDCELLKAEAHKRLKGDAEAEQPKKKRGGEKEGPKMLEEYCKDLCAEVRANRIDPVIGREREVSRVTQILARRTKNNPILLGEPGVGKTAIAEGLAYAIVHRMNLDGTPLPEFLHNKRIMQLDVGLIIAGAKERGELENRVTKLIGEVKDSGNVILMIDEVHTLVGAGSVGRGGGGGGGLDISNLIKPALARGEFQVIGATTVDEHRKYIERDAALERRFQPVYIDEPTEEQTLHILHGLREKYERHHKCAYTDEALDAAVKLSHKYIADRFLPDKAIDLIDEAGSRVRITAYDARRKMRERENPKIREYLQVLETKDEAVKDGLYEEAVILKRREVDYRAELCGTAEEGSSLPVVGAADIEAVVSAWTGIPVERMDEDEKSKLTRLSSILSEHLIGQDDAVETVATALVRARCGLKDPNRPVACLLFVGPTGVGKTELAKVLAEQYFGSREAMIRLDMSEYMERHSVSKLIGAPPGYVGYGDGGKLTEAVRRRPCSIVLMDEIEKAHPDVFSILLQIMEDGRLTDSQGRTVSFKNALVILTSNIGSRTIAGTSSSKLGAFMRNTEEEEAIALNRSRLRQLVLEEVKGYFRPELLNRFDEQVVFHKLGRREVRTIASLMMEETAQRVRERGYALQVTQRLMDTIINEGYSDEYGVRPLRQTIIKYIDDKLSDAMLNRKIPQGSIITMDIDASGTVTATDRLESFTVAGHSSGYNGQIIVVNETASGSSPDGGSSNQTVYLNATMEADNE
mmetsp:Transcript_10026/g.21446  ORF Transcript_10026/g.21446 Transcript_10026/m.21446 type:complete len:958 (+) Transcript_10026:149-3022(+)